ncbi:MAG: energy-coupled thiamine transporter ThiT [Clostridia bacterium]|nr:energy-coupled thiamine transporter ThiT [Clostridia bacterium]
MSKKLTLSALLCALSFALGLIKIFHMPQGGDVTLLSMLPVALAGYLMGPRNGVLVGVATGILNLMITPFVVHPIQLILDYIVAFGVLGLAGIFRNSLAKGYIFGLSLRYIVASISGIVFFSSYFPEGVNVVAFSLWYNLIYLGIEGILTLILILIPSVNKAFSGLKKQI